MGRAAVLRKLFCDTGAAPFRCTDFGGIRFGQLREPIQKSASALMQIILPVNGVRYFADGGDSARERRIALRNVECRWRRSPGRRSKGPMIRGRLTGEAVEVEVSRVVPDMPSGPVAAGSVPRRCLFYRNEVSIGADCSVT